MIFSLFVYLSLMIGMMTLCYCGGYLKSNNPYSKYIWVILASIIFGFVFGIRYNVGIDFPTYYHEYNGAKIGYFSEEFKRWEWGFRKLLEFFANNGFHYSVAFGFLAFLQCLLIFIGVRDFPKIWYLVSFTLILSCTWMSYVNIMRHGMSFSIFVASIPFLAKKQYWLYFLSVTPAVFFHNSSLVLYFFPLVHYFSKVYNKISMQLIFLLIALILMNINLFQSIFVTFSFFISTLGYSNYLTSDYAEFNEATNFGFGFLVLILISFIIIINSKNLKNYFIKSKIQYNIVCCFYDLYFLGLIIHYAFIRMFLVQRLNILLMNLEFIIGAFTIYILFKIKKLYSLYSLVLLYFIEFLGRMYTGDKNFLTYHTFLD